MPVSPVHRHLPVRFGNVSRQRESLLPWLFLSCTSSGQKPQARALGLEDECADLPVGRLTRRTTHVRW